MREQDGATPFVGRRGTSFTLHGERFRFVGANMYNAAGDPAIHQCGPRMEDPDQELDGWFRRAREEFGAGVIRFWAFQSYTRGGTDWRAMDRVMRLAGANGLKVIPVLENQWTECTEGGAKPDGWYAGGYRQPYGAYPLSYREYVQRVVTRYRDEPAVAAWMLMNEAESRSADGHPNPAPLEAFARDMSALVKQADPNHLVTLGVIGAGQPGVEDEHYERLHAIRDIDFLEFHDYNANDEPLPGAPSNPPNTLGHAIEAARRLNKPLLIGEAGMRLCTAPPGERAETPASRAAKFEAKLSAFFQAGGGGYLIWDWKPANDCAHAFSSGDPLNEVLRVQVERLTRRGADR